MSSKYWIYNKGWQYCTDCQLFFICSSKMTNAMASFQNYCDTSLLFFFLLCFSLFMLLAGDYCSLYSLAPTCALFWMSCLLEVIQYHATERVHSCHVVLADCDSKSGVTFCLHMPTTLLACIRRALHALHKAEAKVPCYADNPLFSRCHATQALPK